MKTFGIVSYNIYCNFTNYGSALQSWALSQAINRLGQDRWSAKLIDYCPDVLADIDPLNQFKNMLDKDEESQSVIGSAYQDVKRFLKEDKHVVFSGTPCQIAGLKAYLQAIDQTNLLTIEVICEGVPSPLFVRKYDLHMRQKYGSSIDVLDYRYKVRSLGSPIWKKWDFEVLKKDRWFNPFWSIWL